MRQWFYPEVVFLIFMSLEKKWKHAYIDKV